MRQNGAHNLSFADRDQLAKKRELCLMASLPNEDGFEFYGFAVDGWRYNCIVKKREDGTHYVTGDATFDQLIGWRHKKPHGKAPFELFPYQVTKTYGPTCEWCDGTKPLGNCASCDTPMELSHQGQFEDGEHVCSTDCVNPTCGATQ